MLVNTTKTILSYCVFRRCMEKTDRVTGGGGKSFGYFLINIKYIIKCGKPFVYYYPRVNIFLGAKTIGVISYCCRYLEHGSI